MSSAPLNDFDVRKLGFFCPFCGVKNNAGQTQCFVCGKKVPSFDADASAAPAAAARRGTLSGPNRSLTTAAVAARIGDRMIAVVLDTLLLAALMLFGAAVVWAEAARAKSWPLTNEGTIAAGAGVAAVIAFLYYWLLEGAFGATFGKAIIGVRVGSKSGRRGGFRASAIRNGIRILEGAPLYVPAFLVALFTKARRRIGDLAAKTVVVEYDLPVAARAAVLIGWVVIVAASLWGAHLIAPAWFNLRIR